MTAQRLRIAVEGVVQGVGFRPFVHRLADRHGVRGFVTNRAGDVVIEAEADAAVLRAFVEDLSRRAPANARIDRVTSIEAEVRGGDAGFAIAASEAGTELAAAAIAPDLATCDACLAEIADASARRHGYAFTSCAGCGPRLTIATAAPYDRARTTMAGFPMCAACRAEYDDVDDRRYHAQPIACPACGPQLDTSIAAIAAALRGGEIVALKGLGGYHLACDATREDLVRELRRRKHRDAKPFAVMVADVDAAAAITVLGDADRALLRSAERPIVLVARRAECALAPSVAPGVADIGVMLPYTPLHALLLAEMRGVPLVMTSGNVSDEPIAYRDDDAVARLGLSGIADRVVTHDRPIHMRCDDSIARVVGGAPMVLRRARGYAPAAMRAAVRTDVPTLALGGHLKAAFALGAGDLAFGSPHFGDLDHPATYAAFVAAIAHFGQLHRVAPERVVCDRHPDYATTRLAEKLARDRGWESVRVQHHHAHFASALADARIAGPAIGVVFDGAGYGDDGAIWGGEILVGGFGGVRRAAHLSYVPQPGGDRASMEPWRMAVAHLRAAGEHEALAQLGARVGPIAAHVEALCARPALAPPTSSVGRLFDAVAAIAGFEAAMLYEGQAAMQLEALARDLTDAGSYPIEIAGDELLVAPIIRGVVRDVRAGVAPPVIAARFHATLVELAATACERIARSEGIRDVVLSGGVFANFILADALPRRLAAAGLVPHVHRRVPPNDGGLAIGQLAVAAAAAAARGGA